jgi:riboflavin kinase/FMN adenylyltransferase
MNRYASLDEVPFDSSTVLTIGTFDGVHRGHQAIIDAVMDGARQSGGRGLVITFHPHPQAVLKKTGDGVPLLTTIDERAELFAALGVDAMAVLPFTREFAAIPWQEFIGMLIEKVGVAHMIVGHDHAFGRNREGNVETLTAFGADHGFDVREIGPLLIAGDAISSTKIRRALLEGELEKATNYLGRFYSLGGTVIRGDGRGRQIGIPTANIVPQQSEKVVPANGVYSVRMCIADAWFEGMANIGVRPTFTDGRVRTIEVHLFDFDADIYEQSVTVEFRKFVRSERKFGSKEEFLQQLELDRIACRQAAAEQPVGR